MFLRTHQKNAAKRATDLFLRTQIAFAECEANGIKIDEPYLRSAVTDTMRRMGDLSHFIHSTEVGKRWEEIFGKAMSFTARQQLGTVLFDNIRSPHPRNMGFKCSVWTPSGYPQIAEGVLEKIPEIADFAKAYVLWMSLSKMLTTNLGGIATGLDPNNFIHPSFSLFSVISYRTASSGPNFQNFPNRDKELSGIVRKCFIPRAPDRHLVELDYSGAEVRVNASINHDPTLVSSVTKGVDFHKRIASMAYLLPEEEVTKPLRQSVKGPYTFAAFYGSHWIGIAEGLWEVICYGNLKLENGQPLRQHLMEMGITELGNAENPSPNSYFAHIKKTDAWFWGELFPVYAQWKNKVWESYKRNGYLELPTGFRCAGIFGKNLVTNAPAQGSAAHCLLWSFCRLNDLIKELGLQTKICGQIHDSILLDIPHSELDNVLALANDVMTNQLREAQPWIAVPMEIEADVAPMGKSWWEKEPYEIPVRS